MKLKKIKIQKYDIIIFLIVLLIFGGGLLAFYPGLMTSDIPDQINQCLNGIYSNAHPVFHSFIIGSLYKIFNSTVTIAIFQILLIAVLWTYSCKILRNENITKANIFFQAIFTVFMCLIPINFMYSITFWKDILYTYSILGVIIYIYIGIKNKFNYNFIQMILMSLFLVLVMQIRHNGYPIGLILFGIVLLLNIINNKTIKKTLILLSVFVGILLLSYIPQWTFNVKSSSSVSGTFTSTKLYCMGALLNQDLNLDETEYEFLNNILEIDEWRKNYNLYTGSGILFNANLNREYADENIEKFDDIFFKYAKKYPKVIVKHFIEVNSMFFSIKEKGQMNTLITDNSSLENFYLWKDNYKTAPKSNILNNIYSKIIDKTLSNKILYTTLYRPATLMYLATIIVVYTIYKTKNWSYILLIFPMLLNIGTYLPFISSQDLRYAYPNFVTCYFMILVFSSIFFRGKNVNKINEKKKNIIKEKLKTLIIVPAYNEEKSIKDVVETINRETKNCDILVVNDGSKDNTYQEAKKTDAIVVNLPNNLGIGGAVQTGYLYAYQNNYDIAIQVDADGQHNPCYVSQMVEIISKGQADMVIGSRFIDKTSYKQTFFRMLGINITSSIIKVLTGKKIYDTTSGFRAINREIIESFANEYPYDYPEPCTNMEMILKGKKIMEIPVEMKQRETGVSSISPLKSVKYMLKVTLSLFIMRIKKY